MTSGHYAVLVMANSTEHRNALNPEAQHPALESRQSLEAAYVLHARDYRDSSLLVDLFTWRQGRVAVIARGARRQRKGTSERAALQPFRPLWVGWSGRSELRTLQRAEPRAATVPLSGYALFSGLYANELTLRLLHRDDPHPDLFHGYERLLAALAMPDALLDVQLRHYEFALLGELGYGFSLAHEADGVPLRADAHYRFEPGMGLMACERNIAHGPRWSGAALLAFGSGEYSTAARQALKGLCREALRPHLGERPLASRQLFASRD